MRHGGKLGAAGRNEKGEPVARSLQISLCEVSNYLSNSLRRKGAKPRSPVPRNKSNNGSRVVTTAPSNSLTGRNPASLNPSCNV